MTRFYVTGGRRRASLLGKPEWARFEMALVLELDTESGEVRVLAERASSAAAMPAPGTHVFKAGTLSQGNLWVVTQTEVLAYPEDDFTSPRVWSHGLHNDLHHVYPHDAGFHVVSTGLDSLVSHDLEGEVVQVRHALGEDTASCFDLTRDWRQVPSTKPHRSHPNYYFETEHGAWLTRFEQKDAVCLDDPQRRLEVGVGNPHDGLVHDGSVWFTTTNGHLVRFDSSQTQPSDVYDLHALADADAPLGWCRGLHVDNDVAWIGFSRVRTTRIKKNLSWIRHGFKLPDGMRSPPTRVAAFDLKQQRFIKEWDLERAGMGAIFSIIPRSS